MANPVTIGDEEALVNYAKSIANELRAQMVRVETDFSTDPIKAKVAEAEKARVHTMLVIGNRDLEAGNVLQLSGDDLSLYRWQVHTWAHG